MINKNLNMSVAYTLAMPNPASHYFEIQIGYTGITEQYLDLILPVWRPGRYFIFDFASGVQEFNAFGVENKRLGWTKIDKCTWRITTDNSKEVKIGYKVYANEFELRTRGLNEFHAFINPTAVFMYSEKFRKFPITLKIRQYKDWHVTTGLQNYNNEELVFSSSDYDHFADCPLEIGNHRDFKFDVDGIEHIISIFGDAQYDIDKIKKDFALIIRKNYEFWGSVPYSRYVFIIHCTPKSSGGTEHINSTVVGVKPDAFQKEDSYKDFLRLISHEFFHTWNVKQLRPKGITPYDYTRENYLEELWIAEGGTSYYDSIILSRTGLIGTADMFEEIEAAVGKDRERPGNLVQSLAESSFDAWVKFWKWTEQSFESESDYYRKGADVSMILDLEIRWRSKKRRSLDDVFKTMHQRFPLGKGYTNNDFMLVCEELSGDSFAEFFGDYVYGTKPINWEEYLLHAGLELRVKETKAPEGAGLVLKNLEGTAAVEAVLADSIAESAGLKVNDEIIAVDGREVNFTEAAAKINELKKGHKVKFNAFRNQELISVTLKAGNNHLRRYNLRKTANPSALQKSIFEHWLGLNW